MRGSRRKGQKRKGEEGRGWEGREEERRNQATDGRKASRGQCSGIQVKEGRGLFPRLLGRKTDMTLASGLVHTLTLPQ